MSRTKSPEQEQAEYTWLSPADVAPLIGVRGPDEVCELIRAGHIRAMNVSRSTKARYRISMKSVDKFIHDSETRVATR